MFWENRPSEFEEYCEFEEGYLDSYVAISQANLESSLYNLHADLQSFQSELLDQTNHSLFPDLHQNFLQRSKELANQINLTANELFYLSILVPTRVNLSVFL